MTTQRETVPLAKGHPYKYLQAAEPGTANHRDRERKPILEDDEGDPSDGTKNGKSLWKDTDWRVKLILIYLSIVNYLNSLSHSACSPFLARIVLQKGGTVLLSSIVIQTTTVTMAVFCIIFGRYQRKFGSKVLTLSGLTLLGLSQISFGAIDYFQNYLALVAVGTVLRALQGIYQAALKVAGLTIICQNLPDFISTCYGIFEAAYGAGYFTGPYIGGWLYDWSGGMMVPMAITGMFILLFSIPGFWIVKEPEYRQDSTSESYIRRIVGNPKAIFTLGVAGTLLGGFGLCEATITVYLKPEGFSVTKVGQLLFVEGLSYCLFALSIGLVINSRKKFRRAVISLGILGGIAFPFLWQPNQTTPWIYVAAVGFAMSTALAYIPGFVELRHIVNSDVSASNDVALNSAVSGLWSASSSFFNFFVPLLGSSMEMTLVYYMSFVSSLLVSFAFTIFLMLLSILYKHTNKFVSH